MLCQAVPRAQRPGKPLDLGRAIVAANSGETVGQGGGELGHSGTRVICEVGRERTAQPTHPGNIPLLRCEKLEIWIYLQFTDVLSAKDLLWSKCVSAAGSG